MIHRIIGEIETAAETGEHFQMLRIASVLRHLSEAAGARSSQMMHSQFGFARHAAEAGHAYERALENAERALQADTCPSCGTEHEPASEAQDTDDDPRH